MNHVHAGRKPSSQASLITLLIFSLVTAAPAFADLKIVYKTKAGSLPGSSTVLLIKGNRARSETNTEGTKTVTITRFDINRVFVLNTRDKTYSLMAIGGAGSEQSALALAKAAWGDEVFTPRERERRKRHGRVVFVTSNVDTKERRDMFGAEARHIKIESYMLSEPDACQTPNDIRKTTDAWMIDWPAEVTPVKDAFDQLIAGPATADAECHDDVQNAVTGKARTGMPLAFDSRTVNKSTGEVTASHFEIVDMSSAQVDSLLFEVPPDYAENQEGKDASESVVGQIPTDRKYALPLKIGVGPIWSAVTRNLKLSDLRARLLGQLTQLEAATTDLNEATLQAAVTRARQLQLDYVLAAQVKQADVPDDSSDSRPPFGIGSLEYQLYDVQTGRQVQTGAGASAHTMIEAAADVAYHVFHGVAVARAARQPQPPPAAQTAPQPQPTPRPTASQQPIAR
jgi:hypothetical protein